MPVIGTTAAFAAEVRADSSSSKQHWSLQLILILGGSRHGPPALLFVRDRANELTVTMPAALTHVDLVTNSKGFATLFIPPRIMLGVTTRWFAVGGFERFRIASSQIFELISQIRIDQLRDGLLRDVVVHQPRNKSVRNKGEHEEANARDVKNSRLAFKHGSLPVLRFPLSFYKLPKHATCRFGEDRMVIFDCRLPILDLNRCWLLYQAFAGAVFRVLKIFVMRAIKPPNIAKPAIARIAQNGTENSVDASHGSRAAHDQP